MSATFAAPLSQRIVSDTRFPLAARVLVLYATHGALTHAVYLPPAEMAETLNRSTATIRRTLHRLTTAGYLTAEYRPLRHGGRGSAYRIRAL